VGEFGTRCRKDGCGTEKDGKVREPKMEKQRPSGCGTEKRKEVEEMRNQRGKNSIVWGMIFLLGAAALLAKKLGYVEKIGFWTILFSAILAGFLIKGILKRSIAQILFSLAFLVIVNDELLHLEAITPWTVLWAALFGSIGLKLLFPGFFRNRREQDALVSESRRKGTSAYYESNFGNTVKYLSGKISDVEAECNFGFMQLYFTDVQLTDGIGRMDLQTTFGSVILYIPSAWRVELNMDKSFGDVREKGNCVPDGTQVLYIDGEVNFGSLSIQYV